MKKNRMFPFDAKTMEEYALVAGEKDGSKVWHLCNGHGKSSVSKLTQAWFRGDEVPDTNQFPRFLLRRCSDIHPEVLHFRDCSAFIRIQQVNWLSGNYSREIAGR